MAKAALEKRVDELLPVWFPPIDQPTVFGLRSESLYCMHKSTYLPPLSLQTRDWGISTLSDSHPHFKVCGTSFCCVTSFVTSPFVSPSHSSHCPFVSPPPLSCRLKSSDQNVPHPQHVPHDPGATGAATTPPPPLARSAMNSAMGTRNGCLEPST